MTPSEDNTPTSKQCTSCGIDKPFNFFYPEKTGKYGYHSTCKKCMNAKEREYRKMHPRAQYPIPADVEDKFCKLCDKVLPIHEFGRKSDSKDGLYMMCRTCQTAIRHAKEAADPTRAKRYYDQYRKSLSPEQKKEIMVMSNFRNMGVFPEWYDEQLSKQGGGCAICGVSENGRRDRLSIDHRHGCCKKGRACDNCRRGLLCDRCNIRLGMVEDVEWLAKAVAYLYKHGINSYTTFHEPSIDRIVPSSHPHNIP